MGYKLESYLKRSAKDLPVMPKIAADVMRAVDDVETPVDRIRMLIEQDSAIAARVLKASNSSFYGFQGRIQSLDQAIMLIGRRVMKNLVLAASVKGIYRRFGLLEKLLWEHSTLAGPCAAMLAQQPEIQIETEEAFTAGLLHDIGKTALVNSHHDEYEQVMTRVYNDGVSFRAAEQELFGFDHTELGGRIAEIWNLPKVLASAICHHHDHTALVRLPEDEARMTALITVTTSCLTKLGIGRRGPVEVLDLEILPAWQFLGLSGEKTGRFLELCEEQVVAGRKVQV
jgi:putative nucleotidyltransferase with HDIG domain